MKHLRYINFGLDNAKHSLKKSTVQTYYYLKYSYDISTDNSTINEIIDDYARNMPLKFVMTMYRVNNLEVR